MKVLFLMLFTVLLIILFFPIIIFAPYSCIITGLIRNWGRFVIWAARASVDIQGMSYIDRSQNYIFISNHQSQFDIPLLYGVLPFVYRMVAKKELFWIPIFGWGMFFLGFPSIDRQRRDKAYRSLDRVAEKLKNGLNIMLFPEGTRSRDGELLRFKKGPFYLGIKSGIPILPIVISGSNRVHRKGDLFSLYSGEEIKVRILPPVETKGLTLEDRDDLLSRVEKSVCAEYDQIKAFSLIEKND